MQKGTQRKIKQNMIQSRNDNFLAFWLRSNESRNGQVGVPASSWGDYGVTRWLQGALAGQKWDPYRGRTQVPALPSVGREVVQHKVT